MKVYLDENMPPLLVQPLSAVYLQHSFSSWVDEGLRGKEDIPLLGILKDRHFDAIITRDRNQLRVPEERIAVVESGLRWIGLTSKRLTGLEQITITVSSLVAGLRFVFEHTPEAPTSYHVRCVQPGRSERVKIAEIRTSP